MAIRDKYLTGSVASGNLPPGERSFSQVVTQAARPILDKELNLIQSLRSYTEGLLQSYQTPSGFLRGQSRVDSYGDFTFDPAYTSGPTLNPGFTANAFHMAKQLAVVAGFPVVVEYSNTSTDDDNLIQLDTPPVLGGAAPDAKRTDFVFLEVWQALVGPSVHARATVTVATLPLALDTLTVGGVALTAVVGPPAVDEFAIGVDLSATAINISAAINAPLNSFTTVASAILSAPANVITLRAASGGIVGNAIALLTSNPVSLVLSGPQFLGGADVAGKPSQDTIYRHGNVDSPLAVALPDDLEDPVVGFETTQRIQIQYRIRATGQAEAVNFKSEPDGFSNGTLRAQGAAAAPVGGYPFVPADKATVLLNSSAVAYDQEDAGLWVAGDGSSVAAAALGSCDGYVYAIPIAHVFRRNDAYLVGGGAGFTPSSNTNGGLPHDHLLYAHPLFGNIAVGESDRPDASFVDAINANDIEDKRKMVHPTGVDLQAELEFQMQSLLDGNFRTWAIDGASKQTLGGGSGDVSTRFLVCNEIGRDASHGGGGITSGDTPRGDTIRNFDHVARRFGDQSVTERAVFEFRPSFTVGSRPGQYVVQDNPAFLGWFERDVLHLDLDGLNASTVGDFDPSGASWVSPGMSQITDLAPPGTVITDVLSIRHDDGHSGAAIAQNVQVASVIGVGTGHVEVALDVNTLLADSGLTTVTAYNLVSPQPTPPSLPVDGGSRRRILVEVELTYPIGSGTTDTPDVVLVPDPAPWPVGPMVENDPGQRPTDMETILPPRFRGGFREIGLEYVASSDGAGTPITDTFVSVDPTSSRTLRRIHGSNTYPVTSTDLEASTASTGTITVSSVPAVGAGDSLTLGSFVLVGTAGSRTSGSDDFDATLGLDSDIAGDIAAAINDPLNSFERLFSATPTGGVVTVTLKSGGSLGDLTVFATNDAIAFTLSGVGFMTGGTDTPVGIDIAATEYGSSSRLLELSAPLANAGQTRVQVDYFAQDALPNFGGAGQGYQVAAYFRSNAPQTAGTKEGSVHTPGGVLPPELVVEPLAMSPSVWTGQVGSGGLERPFPYLTPLDQIAVNEGSSTFEGEWTFAATAQILISDFNANTGILSLQPLVSLDGTTVFSFGGLSDPPDKDFEFRAFYDFADDTAYRPTVMSQPLSGVVRHKVFQPFLARATEDSLLYRKGELLLIVLSRWAELDEENTVRFTDTDNTTAAALYRTRGLLLSVSGGHL